MNLFLLQRCDLRDYLCSTPSNRSLIVSSASTIQAYLVLLSQYCGNFLRGNISNFLACDLRAPRWHTGTVTRRTQGRSPFHPNQASSRSLQRTHPLPATPFQCPRSRTATLELGSRGSYLPLRSRLRAEEYDRPLTQSIATAEPSSRTIPTPDRALVARWSLECVTTRSRRSCPE